MEFLKINLYVSVKYFLLFILFFSSFFLSSQEKNQFYSPEFSKLKPQNKPSGLLLGFATSQGYKTLYIIYENGKCNVSVEIPYLATPQKSGFFYIDEKFIDDSEIIKAEGEERTILYTKTFTEPVIFQNQVEIRKFNDNKLGNKPKEIKCDSCWGWDEATNQSIEYIIPGYISLGNYWGGYTGGAHPNHSSSSDVVNFSSFYNYQKDSTFKQELDLLSLYENKKHEINAALFQKGEEGDFIDATGDQSTVDTSNIFFSIGRKNGEVHFFCYANASASYAASGDYAYTAEYDYGKLKQPYINNNNFPVDFSILIQKTYKGFDALNDVLVSPNKNIAYYIMSRKNGREHCIVGIDVLAGREVINFCLSYSSLIMVEWATGKYVESWKEVLLK